jgi:uncharacterized phage protein (TIGR02220 family)
VLTDSPVVNEITQINFSGNIIPISWFKHVKFKNNKPDLLGIMILSEIIYWYRAREERDESTGQIKGYKKKFEADMLQRSYQSFADQFGVSKKQVQEAIYRLRDNGFIVVELRNIVTETKQTLANVTFLAPVPQAIYEITYPSPFQKGDVSLSKGRRVPLEGETYTETTTETTTEIDNILSFEEIEPQKDVIPYQEIVDYLNLKAGTSYRHSTSSTQKLIRARWNEGFRLDDFKQVIDNMTAKWKGDPKMEQYLRPQTLFGTKFESYLQTTSKTKPKEDDPYDEDDWGFKKV